MADSHHLNPTISDWINLALFLIRSLSKILKPKLSIQLSLFDQSLTNETLKGAWKVEFQKVINRGWVKLVWLHVSVKEMVAGFVWSLGFGLMVVSCNDGSCGWLGCCEPNWLGIFCVFVRSWSWADALVARKSCLFYFIF